MSRSQSLVVHDSLRFLITDQPTNETLPLFIKNLKDNNVKLLVRVCEPGYSREEVLKNDIEVVDIPFADGEPPPADVITSWLENIGKVFADGNPDEGAVAVHCVAGLGRAPVMVCIALVEHGLEALDAVEFVRKKRRGALNKRQLNYLEHYERRNKVKSGCCIVM
eukprot:TRINITY_DN2337_c0_g1_i1.p2 TRINITY_DN2337_c0_g1~~TRINITY_DN2337_c0_g1_i1.p2  ORF type:complete len:165 (-),score=25.75 TRINITY_DN2337_c0_g1_i1:177-671(-)